MAVAACALAGGNAHEAMQFQKYFPDLWIALGTAVLGFYALAMILSIWNDVPAIYRSMGVVIGLAGGWLFFAAYSAYDVEPEQYRWVTAIVGSTLAGGIILTAVSMVWWNEKHATIYCRYRMHLFGVILNVLGAAGTFWVIETRQPHGHMNVGGVVTGLFLVVQGGWLIFLIGATLMFPKQPRDSEGHATSCHI